MPENASNIPLDDEDILDLTVVAEPGKAPGAVPRAGGVPDSGDKGAGFGADLDALLDSLGARGSAGAPDQPAGLPAPHAAPIADQTPVDHAVDPDEELAMPEMSDIDSLLAELGADIQAAPAPAALPEDDFMDETPAVATPVPVSSAPMPEFDGIFAQAQAMEAQKTAEEAQPAPAQQAAFVAKKPADPAAVTVTDIPAPAPEGEKGFVDDAGEGGEDDLDLNELDALLDDILATAPEMGSPTAVPKIISVPDQAILPPDHSAEIADLSARVQHLEESVAVLESSDISEAMMEGFVALKVDAKIAEIFEPGSMVMNRILGEIQIRFAEGAFDESLEKMAAAAAAKVIREEITALMQENG